MNPEGCPECGAVRLELLLVKLDRLKHKCGACKHSWWSERAASTIDRSPNYIAR